MHPKLGLLLPLFGGWDGGPSLGEPSLAYKYLESVAREAEDLGFHSLWLPDHLVNPLRDPRAGGLEAWTTAAAIARSTSRIRLSFATLSTGFRPPGLLAKMGATLDRISGGRLILTLGAGWFRDEYQSFGIPWPSHAQRVRRAREQIVLLRKLWGEPRVTFRGRFYQVRDAVVEPRPVQKSSIPIWYGGESPASMHVAAEVADGWIFGDRSVTEAADHVRAFRRLTRRRIDIGMMIGVWPRAARGSEGVDGRPAAPAYLGGRGAEVAEDITRLGASGLSVLLLKFHPTRAGLRRFARDVLPSL